MVNFPVFFTSAVANDTSSSMAPATSFFFKPVFVDTVSAIALLGIAFTALAFMTFIAATMVTGQEVKSWKGTWSQQCLEP